MERDPFSPQPMSRSILARLVLRTGLVKTEQQANVVLLTIAIILLAISAFIVFGSGSGDVERTTPPHVRGAVDE